MLQSESDMRKEDKLQELRFLSQTQSQSSNSCFLITFAESESQGKDKSQILITQIFSAILIELIFIFGDERSIAIFDIFLHV